MALQKNVELENGIILNYHRIACLNKITNIANNIEVNSYINVIQRNKEKEYQTLQKKEVKTEKDQEILEKGINVLIEADFIQIPYDENMTIEDAYDYLKTTDKYNNAKDA